MTVQSRKSPPTHPGYLVFNSKEIKENPLNFYNRMWKEYGDLVRLPIMPNYSIYLLAHPSYAEHVLSTHQELYAKPDIVNKPFNLMMGESILTSEGDFWLKHRRLMQPAFHMKQLAKLADVMVSCTESFLQEWEKKPDGEVIDIAEETLRLTLKIAGQTLFSKDISDEDSVLGQAFRTGYEFINYKMNNLWTEPLWIPTSRNQGFRQAKQTLDKLVLDIINSRRQNPQNRQDLLSMLMSAQDEETGERMSDKQLLSEAITLLVAGHETVASGLAWTWYLLAENPNIIEQLQSELRRVLNGSNPSFEKLPQLEYTRRVFDETLRLYPPAWAMPRTSKQDDQIQGYLIPKNSLITVAAFMIHRHPEFWENPDQFNPDNFLPEKVNQKPNFAYFPFGGGKRICIGKSFALMEATIIIALISQRFKLELLPNQNIEIDPTFTLRPKNGIKVKLWKRN
ncbi:MAG: cytochrome P450 [Richelia sp. RM2_1_2]|nr:cytochrome P450 [Richelia sp. SM2_1_7]NJM21085.1 cytochrome P450 [Richelia sp. SM1_7_0]NJN07591.1 cytochrome P450 [Richelia sp. RM1_1_1]NJO28480.1 cytochrome P450 [Richelia sp. SL_2_1]NJO56941.1 cytochrome P450 [Richelia sp. RM2_1_2]